MSNKDWPPTLKKAAKEKDIKHTEVILKPLDTEPKAAKDILPPEAPEFKVRSEFQPDEAQKVESQQGQKNIGEIILKNGAFMGILAQFVTGDFDDRDNLKVEVEEGSDIQKLINKFFTKYPTLDDFESATVVINPTTGETDNAIENFLMHISKPGKYTKAVADFEDLFYGHHKER